MSLAKMFSLEENIVGGGLLYLTPKKTLTLANYSGTYKSIPKEAAKTLAGLIKTELENKGIEIN